MSTIHWSSEMKTTLNLTTGKRRYYIKCCDVFTRVSRADYESRAADSTRADTLHGFTTGNMRHVFKTVYGQFRGNR